MCYTRRFDREERAREGRRIWDLFDRDREEPERPVPMSEPTVREQEPEEAREKEPVGAGMS